MAWLQISFYWYIVLFILGVVFLPTVKKIFGNFFLDFGYPFAKTFAVLLISYAIFVLATFKIIPFSQSNLILLVFGFSLFNLYLIQQQRQSVSQDKQLTTGNRRPAIFLILFEELLFLASFIFWVYVRGQEPSIRGLEKFMDFGFINSFLRSNFFPPADIWLSPDPTRPGGYPINYYYFGHLTGASIIKLTGIKASVGYNLILATIFAQSVTQVFSLVVNLIYRYTVVVKKQIINLLILLKLTFLGLLGSFIVNLAGNLHTIYAFTTGYQNENPIPFWQILSSYNPIKYWYPNATRFIPFTIHEFPSYSYVVADLHGHVFAIPFVILTLSFLFVLLLKILNSKSILNSKFLIINSIFLGFLIAVHYMTNAFDGPIYFLLTMVGLALIFGLSWRFLVQLGAVVVSFIFFSLPFSLHFSPFIGGIALNCAPDFLTNIGKLGPFLFEKDKCQISPFWMLFVLWGFFWISFLLFLAVRLLKKEPKDKERLMIDRFIFILFSLGTFLVLIPEFFYIKDIYPAHFRANTMFKLGYQAFIMMGIASTFTFFRLKNLERLKSLFMTPIFIFFFFFIAIYPSFSIPSYYGDLKHQVELDGEAWMAKQLPQDYEIVNFINKNIQGQLVILEAQGDSYTDFERISSYTGLPTVAGWWVHEWLWRGSSDIVGKRVPDIAAIFESDDLAKTKLLLKKYRVSYVVISKMEREKYPQLKEKKFSKIGKLIFKSSNGFGALYQVN